jgi:hypothetical protein
MATSDLVQAVMRVPSAIGLTEADSPVTKGSRLMRLPAELRLQIWRLVFAQTTFTLTCSGDASNTHSQPSQPTQVPCGKNTVALLKVNRLIYSEARLFPFQFGYFSVLDYFSWYMGTNGRTSYFTYHNNVLQSLQDWQRCEIRHLRLKVVNPDMKLFVWREYNMAMSTRRDNPRGFRQAYKLLARMDDGEGKVGLEEDIGHWIAGNLPTLPALETVMVGFNKVALDRKRLFCPEPERRPGSSARTG